MKTGNFWWHIISFCLLCFQCSALRTLIRNISGKLYINCQRGYRPNAFPFKPFRSIWCHVLYIYIKKGSWSSPNFETKLWGSLFTVIKWLSLNHPYFMKNHENFMICMKLIGIASIYSNSAWVRWAKVRSEVSSMQYAS